MQAIIRNALVEAGAWSGRIGRGIIAPACSVANGTTREGAAHARGRP